MRILKTEEARQYFWMTLGFAWAIPVFFSVFLLAANTVDHKDGGFRLIDRNSVYCMHLDTGRVHGFEIISGTNIVPSGIDADARFWALAQLIAGFLLPIPYEGFVILLTCELVREGHMAAWFSPILLLPLPAWAIGHFYLLICIW